MDVQATTLEIQQKYLSLPLLILKMKFFALLPDRID